MSSPTKSYEKVFYDLRPAKQVERRMIMDGLGRLMNGGIPIRDYQYTGFGSIEFFDFVLFYKLLGLRRFLSVEHDPDITKRVHFNKPFEPIEVRIAPIGDVISELDGDTRHLLWLDFDDRLGSEMLQDTDAAAFRLSPGSLLLVTVDTEPPRGSDGLTESTPDERVAYFTEQAGQYLPYDFDRDWCAASRLPETNLAIFLSAIRGGLSTREVDFIPLFKFVYADGHRMATLGGMIGGDHEKRQVAACDWSDAVYARRDPSDQAYRIRVPRLTRRERLLLDQNLPGRPGWKPGEFELGDEEMAAYREIHRFYPLYGELLA